MVLKLFFLVNLLVMPLFCSPVGGAGEESIFYQNCTSDHFVPQTVYDDIVPITWEELALRGYEQIIHSYSVPADDTISRQIAGIDLVNGIRHYSLRGSDPKGLEAKRIGAKQAFLKRIHSKQIQVFTVGRLEDLGQVTQILIAVIHRGRALRKKVYKLNIVQGRIVSINGLFSWMEGEDFIFYSSTTQSKGRYTVSEKRDDVPSTIVETYFMNKKGLIQSKE